MMHSPSVPTNLPFTFDYRFCLKWFVYEILRSEFCHAVTVDTLPIVVNTILIKEDCIVRSYKWSTAGTGGMWSILYYWIDTDEVAAMNTAEQIREFRDTRYSEERP